MDYSLDLFKPLTRDQRQEIGRQTWIKNKCRGTLVYPTGVGKTRTALNCLQSVLKKYTDFRVLVVVPTDTLKNQWQEQIDNLGLQFNCEVQIINTVIRHTWACNILVIDECHRFASDDFSKIFEKVKYKYILGLTATFERLDGKEVLISEHCPVIDTITTEEALLNGWISRFTEYRVLIDVDNIDEYKDLNKQFQQHFEFFNYDFGLAMKMVGKDGYKYRIALRDKLCNTNDKTIKSNVLKTITYHAMGFMQVIQKRKSFINNHPKKLEITRKIIEARKDKKIITFSNNTKMAEAIGIGEVYTGKDSKKKGRTTIEEFNKKSSGVINSCAKLNEGADLRGLSVAIILGLDSSKTKATQRRGRAIRFEPGKEAEIFNIVINNTVENEWFVKSHENEKFTTVDEANLDKILAGEEYNTYQKPIPKLSFRF